jgi:hypothetical protein
VRWFAAEFLVVVSGILVALALQAWWAGRADRAMEHAVLRQMMENLVADSARLAAGADNDSVALSIATRLARHMEMGGAFSDSLAEDFGHLGMAGTATLQTAPYQTLQTKGLDLIQNDSLRSAIVSFYEVVGESLETHNEWLRSAESRWMPFVLKRFSIVQGPQRAYPRKYEALLRDEDFLLFLDEYKYYIGYAAPWKLNAATRAGRLAAQIRTELD